MYLNVYVLNTVIFCSLAIIVANLQIKAGETGSVGWRTGC